MSKLDQLIKELCPDGVEWNNINSVMGYEQPNKYIVQSTKYSDEFDMPVLTAGQSFVLGYTDEKEYIYKASKENAVIIFDDFTTSFHWVDFDFKIKSSAMKMLKPKNITHTLFRYLYHVMKNIKYIPVDHTRQWIGKYSQSIIPIPPLPVQEEIVRILDNFNENQTALIRELEEELNARKQQYEFYRDTLLTFTDDVEVKSFGETATIVRGASPRPINDFMTNKTGVNWIKIGDSQKGEKYITSTKQYITLEGKKKSRFVKAGDFVLSNSMSFGRPYILKIDGCIHDGWLSISNFSENFVSDFLYHLLCSHKIQITMSEKASSGTVQNLNADIVKSIELPLPSLDEQKRIVKILDNFENKITELTLSLKNEITARKQQYEFYRDKLLTFKDINNESN